MKKMKEKNWIESILEPIIFRKDELKFLQLAVSLCSRHTGINLEDKWGFPKLNEFKFNRLPISEGIEPEI